MICLKAFETNNCRGIMEESLHCQMGVSFQVIIAVALTRTKNTRYPIYKPPNKYSEGKVI